MVKRESCINDNEERNGVKRVFYFLALFVIYHIIEFIYIIPLPDTQCAWALPAALYSQSVEWGDYPFLDRIVSGIVSARTSPVPWDILYKTGDASASISGLLVGITDRRCLLAAHMTVTSFRTCIRVYTHAVWERLFVILTLWLCSIFFRAALSVRFIFSSGKSW